MCGISGILAKSFLNLNSLEKMNSIISHRGPDDEGFVLLGGDVAVVLGGNDTAKETWQADIAYCPKMHFQNFSDNHYAVGFGHRRLSILDLSPNGHQPMCSFDKRYWITYNGEVYNYLEIRKELETLGHQFHTNTDTEVILAAYQYWGTDCQHKFNGMWAFAIYDTVEKTVFLSRDRFGIKPLYYWFSPSGDFYFASEIKQFTVLPEWRAILNKKMACDYLYFSTTDHCEETLFKGVYKIAPGHYLQTPISKLQSQTTISPIKWYHPTITPFTGSFEEATRQFKTLFQDAVQLHVRSDVAVGSALSGGLDSSSIVSYINVLLRQEDKQDLQKTFSSCATDKRYDEREWIDEVVKETHVDGHYVYPKGEDVFTKTEKIIWHMDEPYQSQTAFMGYHVFEEAARNQVRVLLNGQGADEYLSCYGDFRQLRQFDEFLSFKWAELMAELGSVNSIFNLLKSITYKSIPNSIKYLPFINRYNYNGLSKIYNTEILKLESHPYSRFHLNKLDKASITNYMLFSDPLQRYLRWEDRNSMAHSVEARVPFLDYRLVEFGMSLPLEYLDAPNQTKRVLVEAMKGILPEKVRNRKDKKGFITPEERWFKQDHKQAFINLFNDNVMFAKGIINRDEALGFLNNIQKSKSNLNPYYWHLILFGIWMKVFKVELQ